MAACQPASRMISARFAAPNCNAIVVHFEDVGGLINDRGSSVELWSSHAVDLAFKFIGLSFRDHDFSNSVEFLV
jgi:hypothetical protein